MSGRMTFCSTGRNGARCSSSAGGRAGAHRLCAGVPVTGTVPEREERVFVADYQVRLPTEETIKERLEELADSAGQDEESV